MLLFGVIVSLCYVPGITGAFIATQWAVLSILLPWFLWRSAPLTAFHWAGLAFIAYAAVRLWYAPIFDDGVYGLWMVCIMALSFWLGSTLDSSRKLYAGLAIGGAVSSLIAVLQAFGVETVPYITPAPAGLYVNSVAQGLTLSLIAVALVSERMWIWLPALLPGIVLSASRGAWVALVVGLAAAYGVRRVWILGAVAVLGVFMLTRAPSPSDSERLYIWGAVLHNLTWLGWGPGAFSSWLLWYGNISFYPEYAHNDALQLIFEYGMGAALPLGATCCILAQTRGREWPVVAAFVTAGCYSMPLWVPVASFLACVVAGRAVRDRAVARHNGYNRRPHVVSRQRRTDYASYGAVSVVAHHSTKGVQLWP